MKRLVKILIVVILAVAAVVGGRKLVLKRQAELRKEKAVVHYALPVRVAKVKRAPFVRRVRYLGKVESNAVMTLKARISGSVTRRNHLEGDPVKKGELLIALDTETSGSVQEMRAKIAVIKAKIASLNIREKNLAAIYKRDTVLYKNGAISEEAWELSENRLAEVRGQIQALIQEIATIKTRLAYTKIMSPYDGVMSQYFVKVGDTVFPGQQVCQIIRKGSYKVKIEVTPVDAARIPVGTPVKVGNLSLTVSRIYPATSPRSLSILEADFKNESCPYKLNEIVPVKIQVQALKEAWIVPVEAVLHEGRKALVFGVRDGKIAPINVAIQAIGDVDIALASQGLKEGLPVICAHESRLMTFYKGQSVKIVGEFSREALK